MLSVCSATPSHYSYSPIPSHVTIRSFSSFRISEDRHIVEDGLHTQDVSFRTQVTKRLQSLVGERNEQGGSLDSSIISSYKNEFDDIMRGSSNKYFDSQPEKWNFLGREMNRSYYMDDGTRYLEGSKMSEPEKLLLHNDFAGGNANELSGQNIVAEPIMSSNTVFQTPISLSGDELLNLHNMTSETSSVQSESASTEFLSVSNSPMGIISDKTVSVSGPFEPNVQGFSKLQENIDNFLSGISMSLSSSIDKLGNTATEAYNAIAFSVAGSVTSVTTSFNDAVSSLFLSSESAKQQASTGVTRFSFKFSDSLYSISTRSIDILKQAIIALENSLANVSTVVVYSYESAKLLLPPEVRNALDISEGKAMEILRPIGTGFQQVYFVIEQFERSLGFDPSDPIVPFSFFVGSSATLGVSYWVLTYGGYSGDLSPQLTLELLKNEENAVLIDVRPEDLRETDGIPDLRRNARFKYASVTIPEIDSPTRKLLKSGRDIEDALLAVVIRSLKIVQDGSKVVVMDAMGDRSKDIARVLRKLGVKRSYLVQGGFRSWVKDGLRIKELKPETTLTILNEEAEAILEDIKPTPALVIGYGLGISAAIYALLEWEKTLQLIGIIGLGQTLYQRVALYQDSEDLKKDVRLLLAPVRLGAQAFTWAAGQLEPTKIGLPTSPSSTAVQDRVQQAAAKHESQPSDTEESQNPSPSENLDLSEA